MRRWEARENQIPGPHIAPNVGAKDYPLDYRRDYVCPSCGGKAREVLNNWGYWWVVSQACKKCSPMTHTHLRHGQRVYLRKGKRHGPFIAPHVDGKTGRLTWRRYDPPSTNHPARYKTLWQARHATKEDNEKLGQLQFLQKAKMPKRLKVEGF